LVLEEKNQLKVLQEAEIHLVFQVLHQQEGELVALIMAIDQEVPNLEALVGGLGTMLVVVVVVLAVAVQIVLVI
jgi:hypothetical protein